MWKYAQENIIVFIIALKEVYKYCHLVVVIVIEFLVNSPYNAVMSGGLLEARHSLLYLYYELLITVHTKQGTLHTKTKHKAKNQELPPISHKPQRGMS